MSEKLIISITRLFFSLTLSLSPSLVTYFSIFFIPSSLIFPSLSQSHSFNSMSCALFIVESTPRWIALSGKHNTTARELNFLHTTYNIHPCSVYLYITNIMKHYDCSASTQHNTTQTQTQPNQTITKQIIEISF